MTISDFKLLTTVEQDEEVLNHGIYVLNYVQGEKMCDIYKVSNFFVKFSFDLTNDTKPEIIPFTGTDDFRLYEEKVFPFSGN